jgi:general stress protein 26
MFNESFDRERVRQSRFVHLRHDPEYRIVAPGRCLPWPMPTKTLPELSKRMREIDFAMLSTHTENNVIAGRPMSNNRQVDYDGSSYYFTYERYRTIADIERDANVALGFQGTGAFFVHVEGRAELIRDKAQFKAHWTSGLDRWFPQGIETPGIVLIKVVASRVHYWDGEEDGEIVLRK